MNEGIRIKRSPTLSSKAAEALRKYLNENFSEGGKIPGEHELAETLGVNRGTIRTALAMLEREGSSSVAKVMAPMLIRMLSGSGPGWRTSLSIGSLSNPLGTKRKRSKSKWT